MTISLFPVTERFAAEVGARVGLRHTDAASGERLAQRRRQVFGAHVRLGER